MSEGQQPNTRESTSASQLKSPQASNGGSLPKLLSYVGWPAATGLLLAIIALLLIPQINPVIEQNSNTPLNLSNETRDLSPEIGEWSGPVSYKAAVRRAKPAVVSIYRNQEIRRPSKWLLEDPLFRQLFNTAALQEQQRMLAFSGSGVIVSDQGYLLTNLHVIDGAENILVQLSDGREAVANVLGVDENTDLAVLKIEMDNLASIPIGMSDKAEDGDVVLAIGNPFGVGLTVTQGIISATNRVGKTQAGIQNFIQTDAAINPGNSGGALVDAYGNLLGINTAVLGGGQQGESIGIGFATPVDTAIEVLNEIVELGTVVRGWLGIEALPLNSRDAKQLNLSFTTGMRVTHTVENGPAEKAGIQTNDVITRIRVNDNVFDDESIIVSLVSNAKPGDIIELEIWRNGKPQILNAIIEPRPTAS
ncbi:Do family serine endopeptidase AlgW [Aurantivibrio infirmus]